MPSACQEDENEDKADGQVPHLPGEDDVVLPLLPELLRQRPEVVAPQAEAVVHEPVQPIPRPKLLLEDALHVCQTELAVWVEGAVDGVEAKAPGSVPGVTGCPRAPVYPARARRPWRLAKGWGNTIGDAMIK